MFGMGESEWTVKWENIDPSTPLVREGGIDLVVGREDECKILKMRGEYGSGINFLITGAWGVGKTTMLLWAKNYAFKEYPILLLGNKSISSVEKFEWAIINATLTKLKEKHSKEMSDFLRSYIKNISHITRDFKKDKFYLYDDILKNLPIYMYNDGIITDKHPLLVFIDDFNPTGSNYQTFREWLKSYMSERDKLIYISVAMQVDVLTSLMNEDPALLSRFAPTIKLRFLNDDEMKELIKRRLMVSIFKSGASDVWYPFTEKAIDKIVEESGGVPRNAIILLYTVLSKAVASAIFKIDEKFVSKILREEKIDVFSHVLANVVGGYGQAIYETVKMLGGCARLRDIGEELGKSPSFVSFWIKKMEEVGLIVKKERGLYCIGEK